MSKIKKSKRPGPTCKQQLKAASQFVGHLQDRIEALDLQIAAGIVNATIVPSQARDHLADSQSFLRRGIAKDASSSANRGLALISTRHHV
jgi:hypothetical protein